MATDNDPLFELCEAVDDTVMFEARRFARVILGDLVDDDAFEFLRAEHDHLMDRDFQFADPRDAVYAWTEFHRQCIFQKTPGPHPAAIDAFRAFAKSERCARFRLFLRKKRGLTTMTPRVIPTSTSSSSSREALDFLEVVDVDGNVNMRALANLVIGPARAYAVYKATPPGIRFDKRACDLSRAIAAWIAFHGQCVANGSAGPHTALINTYRAFEAGDVHRRLCIFADAAHLRVMRTKARQMRVRANRSEIRADRAERMARKFAGSHPDATALLDVEKGGPVKRARVATPKN